VRRATQQRGCLPQRTRIDQGPTGRHYRFSRMVPCYRRDRVTAGRDPGRGGDPRRRKSKGGGSNVPASCSSTVQVDLTRGKREREGSLVTKKYKHRGPRRGHNFLKADRTDRAA